MAGFFYNESERSLFGTEFVDIPPDLPGVIPSVDITWKLSDYFSWLEDYQECRKTMESASESGVTGPNATSCDEEQSKCEGNWHFFSQIGQLGQQLVCYLALRNIFMLTVVFKNDFRAIFV